MKYTKKHQQEMIGRLLDLAVRFMKTDDGRIYRAIWNICCEWNRRHEDLEIAVYETSDDDDNVNGFAIEDEVFYFNK